jgi:catechol 2,3-dioxygenase-like lactoylglutathione lyase family enzyme
MKRFTRLSFLRGLAGGGLLRRAARAADGDPIVAATGAFFALSVADRKASAQWYAQKLGLKVTMETPKTGGAAATVLEGGGLIVELVERDDARSSGAKDSMQLHGIAKAGVIVRDFDRTVAVLKQRGVEIAFGPFPARPGQRANVIVKDNAGNLIQFFG